MSRVYLFDWGNTLMVDDPAMQGKMKDWPQVSAISGARDTLQQLAENNRIYVASGARDSDEKDIGAALDRVGLSAFISGYFCPANLGLAKGTPEFLEAVLARLAISAEEAVVVGDSYVKDIEPALTVGILPVWLCKHPDRETRASVTLVSELTEILSVVEPGQR